MNRRKIPDNKLSDAHRHYQQVSAAIACFTANSQLQPTLAELSEQIKVSVDELTQSFEQWAGVLPTRFLQYLRKENDLAQLQQITGQQLFQYRPITPKAAADPASGLTIRYGIHSSLFGYCFIAANDDEICKLVFFDQLTEAKPVIAELTAHWRGATVVLDPKATEVLFQSMINPTDTNHLKLLLRGTPFQLEVWDALLYIPSGQLHSYQQVAEAIGRKSSVRAVATAIARNPVGFLVPCHRVIRSNGELNKYRWGAERKAAMIGWEARHKWVTI